jgi:hypothetical protein
VLHNIDSSHKGIDEFLLLDVIQAVRDGSIRPSLQGVLNLIVSAITFQFDWRKNVSSNMEQLRAIVNRVQSYGISHDESYVTRTVLANVRAALQHE